MHYHHQHLPNRNSRSGADGARSFQYGRNVGLRQIIVRVQVGVFTRAAH